jgi:hypothetical protein
VVAGRDRPGGIVSDNRAELTLTAILAWANRKRSPGITSPRASWGKNAFSTVGYATSCRPKYRCVGHQCQAFEGVVVGYRRDAQTSPIGHLVMQEVEHSALVRPGE